MKLPTIEVRYKNLCVEAQCEVVEGKPLPTLWNTAKRMLSVSRLYHPSLIDEDVLGKTIVYIKPIDVV